MYPVSHAPHCDRLSILALEVYLRRNDSPAPTVLNDAVWQMKIDAPEWAKLSPQSYCRPVHYPHQHSQTSLARLETGDGVI